MVVENVQWKLTKADSLPTFVRPECVETICEISDTIFIYYIYIYIYTTIGVSANPIAIAIASRGMY